MMPSAAWTRFVIYLAAAVWFIASLILGLPVNSTWFRPLGITTSIVIFALLLFDSILWRWLPYSLTKVPNLRGTWMAKLTSSHKDDNGKPTELTCFFVVRQSYSRIHLEMLFPKSESTSTSANIVKTDGTSELWYSYRSTAHSLERERNPPHIGAVRLRIAINNTVKLSGDYWTDRESFGRLETVKHNKKLVTDYAEAVNLFGI